MYEIESKFLIRGDCNNEVLNTIGTLKNNWRKTFIIFSLIFTFAFSFAQEKPNSFATLLHLEINSHYGFLIPHHTEIWALTNGYFPVWEVSIFKQTDGRKHYHYLRKYPQLGVSYLYSDFGISENLGVMHAIIPNIRLPLISGKKVSLSFGMGLGVAYLSKKFDRFENYKNLTIGSHINAAVNFKLKSRWKINSRVHFNTGVSVLHVSNGTVKTPNYGLNVPAAFAGIDWKINTKEIKYHKPEILPEKKGKMNIRIIGSLASKQISRQWDMDFMVYIGTMILSGYYNNTNRLLIGIDGVYDESVKYMLEQKEQPTEELMDVAKIGVNIGHEWTFSWLSIFMNLGYYVHNNYENDAVLYNKIGMNIQIMKFAFVGVNLQAHWGQAEFLSFGLGLNL